MATETTKELNYDGVLNPDGSILVAKTSIVQKILHIAERTVLVRGRKKSYHCEIHKDMYSLMDFVEEGDYAYVKFKNGKAWFVGFKKAQTIEKESKNLGSSETLSEGVDA